MGTNTIHDREKASQLVLYKGLRKIDGCSPTDIDGIMAIRKRGKVFIIESKFKGAELKRGQRMIIEDLVNAFWMGMHWVALGVHAAHDTEGDDVDISASMVVRLYFEGRWQSPWDGFETVGELYDYFWDNL